MLKKLINWYQTKFMNTKRLLKKEHLNIKNHIVDINGDKFYLAKAMVTDIPEMVGIERDVYDGVAPWTEEAFMPELKPRLDRFYLLLRQNDQLVAFIGSSLNDKKLDCHISNVAVEPDFQDRGLGYFLVAKVIKKARQLNYKTVSLEVRVSNVKAQRLYMDLGFKKMGVKENYYDGDHEDAVDMVLDLSLYETIPNNYGM
ncbi:ribosomal protein S18-alanine N-acetyltransferase [Apilactobacillus apinorum]|uniref:Ribosomal protein S18-alanine N-acetyltransferase n=1 Tax=Apilactobacillus apinorum TaxID=1218495 RepID=A0ABP9ZGD9_9LACO|nr:ribosomal protein S18-alanine N-acetyltransferase [Apilactobacillus apinorum]KOY69409.1 Ribosomal-protein-alanine acetyltransferase [Apilactobacillus apinorum]CAI2637749.1 Ribosomal-protein-alanine acetyltransferase [Apilactobacillus apinorum]